MNQPGKIAGYDQPDSKIRDTVGWLIEAYFWLWIFEGALRKWIFPQWSAPLAVIREPLVVVIYIYAFRGGFLRPWWPVVTSIVLGGFMLITTMATVNPGWVVLLYGLRANVLHIPLIFVIGAVWTSEDVKRILKKVLVLAIPTAALTILQFLLPDSILNVAAGGEGSQISGALGRVRPSAYFSYPVGVSMLASLVVCFSLYSIFYVKSRREFWQNCTALVCAIMIYAISISRGAVVQGVVVVAVFFGSLSFVRGAVERFFYMVLGGAGLFALLSFVPLFRDGVATFFARMNDADTASLAGFYEGIVLRAFDGYISFFDVMFKVPLWGLGLGAGTNAAAFVLDGEYGFLLAEDEWSRLVQESGPVLGPLYLAFRMALAWTLAVKAWRALNGGNILPIVLFSACYFQLTTGQWGPPVSQGGTMFIAGLALAACNPPKRGPRPQRGAAPFFARRIVPAGPLRS
jgi:hypothetical protein